MNFNLNRKASVSVAALEANTDQGSAPAIEPTEVVNTDSEGETQKARAIALAGQESEAMGAAVTLAANAKEDWQGGPIKVLFAMNEAYGDELASFPKPDMETGNNPDKFKVPMPDGKGSTAIRSTSFYLLFSDATREGKALVDELEYLKRIANVNDKCDDIPEELMELYRGDENKRISRENYLKNRRSTVRTAYKKAMALYFQMDAVAGLEKVGCDFDYADSEAGEVEKTSKPILVWSKPDDDKKPITKFERFSIGSFLKLNAAEASENGGTLKALMKTVARDTNTKAAAFPTIKTAESYVAGLVECFRAMDEFQSDSDQKEIGKLMKILGAKGSDELKVAIVEYRNYLDDIVDDMKLGPWYADLQAKRSPLVTRKKAA